MRVVTCIEDLRLLARRRVPRMFYAYVDAGSWTESTYRANERDLATICFRQRVAGNIEKRSIQSTMIGEDGAIPVALAPTGLCGMLHADPCSPCRRGLRGAVLLIDDEHLLDRGCRGQLHDKFSLTDFHDRLLAGGLVPIKIIRREMIGADGPVL